jgi:4-amino-4-deoxy-L-arabinose transferase-like glycosyltransferase
LTGPAAGEPDRGTSVPTRTTRTREAASTIVIVLGLGFVLRLFVAYLFPGSGFTNDLASFRGWAYDLATNGPFGFYARPGFHDYTPGYLYFLWLVGVAQQALPGLELIKVPAMLADLALGYLAWSMVLELGASRRAALVAAVLVVFNPITWFDSVIWGQVDSVGVVFMLLGVRELWRDRPERATIFAVLAAITKPQLGILIPIVGIVVLRRYAWDPLIGRGRRGLRDATGTGTGDLESGPATEGVFTGHHPIRLLTTAVAGAVTAVALSAPFGLSIFDLLHQIAETAGGYTYLTVNAFNPWALVEQGRNGLASNGAWICDAVTPRCSTPFLIGPFWAVFAGAALLIVCILVIAIAVGLKPDRLSILVGLAVLALAFFVVPTRVHERYLFAFVPLGAILAAVSRRWLVAFAGVCLALFANMYVVLAVLYPGNPKITNCGDGHSPCPPFSSLQGVGDALRSPTGVTAVAIIAFTAFVWGVLQLRRSAREALKRELLSTASEGVVPVEVEAPVAEARQAGEWDGDWDLAPVAGSRPSAIALAASSGTGIGGMAESATPWQIWRGGESGPFSGIRRWLVARPVRPDRSRALEGEGGGRFDRLDVWVIVVLVVAALGLRLFRLAEPYQMHFDEVYHARTGTEFLQDWRYGIPHSIYEYTHPHLAKYAMALGIEWFGDDQVTGQSDLGVGVRDAAIEPRWDDATMPEDRAGDRLYVATGGELRAYDLRDRGLIASFPIPGASAAAVDTTNHRLFVGAQDGTIFEVDTSSGFDQVRTGTDPASLPQPISIGSVDVPIERLFATSTGDQLVAQSGDQVISVDAGTGSVLGQLTVKGAADMASAGTVEAVIAHTDEVVDRQAAANQLAKLLGGNARDYATKLASGAADVPIEVGLSAALHGSVQAAMDAGQLRGFEFLPTARVAIASGAGVTFITPGLNRISSTIQMAGGATGLAATSGLDASRLYVANQAKVAIVRLSNDQDPAAQPYTETTMPMPARVERVTYDPATLMVHVLGQRPDGDGSTIYVIEPHANSVYEDAPLPFTPVAWATDVAAQYPSSDRHAILAFSADGTVASVDVGSNQFAWRLPGVILGALTVGLLYVLARILFRRRSVAIMVGILALADGMLFVMARIAMNDVYVGFFLIAAYALFAALWTGAWRARWAFWVAMPVIGLLLGLALASKWVAAYAIAAIAVLILVRSALGRIVTIAGLLALTFVLGYMAISVPQGATSGGNLVFILVMIGLTLLAVVVTVLHPIAWSMEELWIAVGAPAAVGAAVAVSAVAFGKTGARLPLGGGGVPLMAVAFAFGLLAGLVALAFWLAGRFGFGPLAPAPAPGDPVLLTQPPAPAPRGWLRPGWGFGIPVIWMIGSLLALPLLVYVVSYIPWALNGTGQRITSAAMPLIGNWPPGHTGDTLWDLTQSMYHYHDTLRAGHDASSPWWAWPLDLKPVWFYQGAYANGTGASIYDAGNLAIWWLGIPAMAFAAWQAYRRRSLALALVTIGFAWQWLAWSRIDRATFEYHYYTSVPFIILALAYFLAELWHGPSLRTWLLARAAAGLAILGPALLWLGRQPLCGFAQVNASYQQNNHGYPSPACAPDFGQLSNLVVTAKSLGIVLVMGVAIVLLLYQVLRLEEPNWQRSGRAFSIAPLVRLGATALGTVLALYVVLGLDDSKPLYESRGFSTELIAFVGLLILGFLAAFVVSARDSRRFVAGALFAIAATFLIFYPNLSALPLPSAVVNSYQGLLPTYLWPFQFQVNRDPAGPGPSFTRPEPLILLAGLIVACLIVGYSAWVWRIALAERAAEEAGGDGEQPAIGSA